MKINDLAEIAAVLDMLWSSDQKLLEEWRLKNFSKILNARINAQTALRRAGEIEVTH